MLILGIILYFCNNALNLEDTIFHPLLETFLAYETILSLILLAAYIYGIIAIKTNKRTYLKSINSFLVVFIYFSYFATLATNQIEFSIENLFYLLFIFVFAIILSVCEFSKENNADETNDYFSPIREVEKLFPSNKAHFDRINTIINLKNQGNFSICLSGKWGAGKTSIINCVETENSNHHFIRINALEIDEFNSLFKYFYDYVKSILDEKGTYTGINSEYQTFISSCIGTITDSSVSDLISAKLFPSHDNYRDAKDSLNKTLNEVLADERIIVVVDDLERSSSETIKSFIFFIREIASFSKCISIFVTDFEILSNVCKDTIVGDNFFDKFFNYRIDVLECEVKEMTSYFEGFISVPKILEQTTGISYNNIFASITTIEERFNNQISKINEEIDKSKKDNDKTQKQEQLSKLEEIKNFFYNSINNPRKLSKIYKSYSIHSETLNNAYSDLLIPEDEKQKLIKYAKTIEIPALLFLVSYIEVCLPEQFLEIKNVGIVNYLNKLSSSELIFHYNRDLTLEEFVFIQIATDLLFEKPPSSSVKYKYQYIKSHLFVDTLLDNNSELKNIINGFTLKQEEWIAAVANDKLINYINELNNITETILNFYSNEEYKKDRKYTKTLEFLEKIFVVDRDRNNCMVLYYILTDKTIWSSTYNVFFMEKIHKIYFEEKSKFNLNTLSAEDLKNFSENFGTTKCKQFEYFFNTLSNYKENHSKPFCIKHFREKEGSFIEKLHDFINKESKLLDPNPLKSNIIEKMNELVDKIKEISSALGHSKYSDVADKLALLPNNISDLDYFIKIYDSIEEVFSEAISIKDEVLTNSNIDNWICDIIKKIDEEKVVSPNMDRKLLTNFYTIFPDITQDNIKKLHIFLDNCYENYHYSTLKLRTILFEKEREYND